MNFITTAMVMISLNTLKRREMMKLLENLLKIDTKIPDSESRGCSIWKFLKPCVVFLVVLVHIGVLMLESWFWRNQSNLFYEIIVRFTDLFHMTVVVIFCSAVNIINMKLKNISDKFEKYRFGVNGEFMELTESSRIATVSGGRTIKMIDLRRIRREYYMLYCVTGEINRVFGFTILLVILKYSITFIYNMYCVYSFLNVTFDKWNQANNDPLRRSIAYFWVAHVSACLYLMMHSCESTLLLTKKLCDNVQKLLLEETPYYDDSKQLKLFESQISYNKIEFYAVAFNLNSLFFCTLLTSVCTYTIILIELSAG